MAMAAPGVLVSAKTVLIAVCSSGMDWGPLWLSAPDALHEAATDNNSAIAIRFVEMEVAKGEIIRLTFYQRSPPAAVPASAGRGPSSPARTAHLCDHEAIARFQVVPTFARVPRSVASPRTNHGFLQSTKYFLSG